MVILDSDYYRNQAGFWLFPSSCRTYTFIVEHKFEGTIARVRIVKPYGLSSVRRYYGFACYWTPHGILLHVA
ncbi:hypothetical protein COCCADRAFT_104108 [Bipolaris zeicola 26-R-13]|uniref:Uncharacterized protein n=1 Tax=Cochliobolus carbonum (strain 26-R-13) TaxID=930089 RepID=W6XS76_COCC2|nr:uncharacterized protein COCCADRAFT_104108 [Bipolaris zeicola 26-R-13]EUC30377.1 hypothetical protein COCCADRAFT_104108 [Bipolaris zeicola 26-R-13]